MKTHYLDEETLKTFVCSTIVDGQVCGKRYVSADKLESHVNNFHNAIKKYCCELCDSQYFSSKDLVHHKRVVHDKIKIKCQLCPTLVSNFD